MVSVRRASRHRLRRPRLTADVDVTARLPPGAGTAWLATIESHGFERRFLDAKFVEQSRVIPITHLATGLPVDIVLAGPGREEQFLERAASLAIDGVAVPVIEVSDLVILKVLAGRPRTSAIWLHCCGSSERASTPHACATCWARWRPRWGRAICSEHSKRPSLRSRMPARV